MAYFLFGGGSPLESTATLRCLLVPKQAGNRGERVSFAWVAGGLLGAQPTLFKGTVGSPPPFPGEVCGLFSVVSL